MAGAAGATGRIDFAGRGKGLDELVATLRRIWAGEPAGDGLGPVGPRPAQPGGAPIWLGGEEFVRSMTEALPTTLEAIRTHVAGYREIGMDELFLWPASSVLGQVEALSEVVL